MNLGSMVRKKYSTFSVGPNPPFTMALRPASILSKFSAGLGSGEGGI